MISENTFDILMEIRKIDQRISEQKDKVTQGSSELLSLERNIDHLQKLRMKAQIILKDTEGKLRNTQVELKNVHHLYNKSLNIIAEDNIVTNVRTDTLGLEDLRKQREYFHEKLLLYKAAKEETAQKLNNTELQISIEKKKNAAILIRLRKDLEELLEEEKKLGNQIKP